MRKPIIKISRNQAFKLYQANSSRLVTHKNNKIEIIKSISDLNNPYFHLSKEEMESLSIKRAKDDFKVMFSSIGAVLFTVIMYFQLFELDKNIFDHGFVEYWSFLNIKHKFATIISIVGSYLSWHYYLYYNMFSDEYYNKRNKDFLNIYKTELNNRREE